MRHLVQLFAPSSLRLTAPPVRAAATYALSCADRTANSGMKASTETPAAAGFRMPAEWERHARTWIGWPQREDNWRDGAGPAQAAYAEVASAISKFEPVTVCANPEQVQNAREKLPEAVTVEELPHADAWFRDTGPTFLTKGCSLAGVDWQFNGYGGDVYEGWEQDKQVAGRILDKMQTPAYPADFVLEGGSIHVDGEGTLLTTEECLLHPNRNPGLSKLEVEERLKAFTGSSKVLWLPKGLLADEDTNGHVDNFACFAAPATVLLAWPSHEDPEQLLRSEAALAVLESERDAHGRKLRVIKLPLPPPLHYEQHEEIKHPSTGQVFRAAAARLAASYVNFYICNGGVVIPAFGGSASHADEIAKGVLEAAFPDRMVVQIRRARDILLGGGNIHCITQQQPWSAP